MELELETERLLLRRPEQRDVDRIVAGIGDFEVARWLKRVPHPYTAADAASWLATIPARPALGRATFAIDLKGEGYVGSISIVAMLGYWIARPFWGRGLATEASVAIVQWYFANGGDEPLASGVLAGNEASMRVQRKLGFVTTGGRNVPNRALGQEVELVETRLTCDRFATACQMLRRALWT